MPFYPFFKASKDILYKALKLRSGLYLRDPGLSVIRPFARKGHVNQVVIPFTWPFEAPKAAVAFIGEADLMFTKVSKVPVYFLNMLKPLRVRALPGFRAGAGS